MSTKIETRPASLFGSVSFPRSEAQLSALGTKLSQTYEPYISAKPSEQRFLLNNKSFDLVQLIWVVEGHEYTIITANKNSITTPTEQVTWDCYTGKWLCKTKLGTLPLPSPSLVDNFISEAITSAVIQQPIEFNGFTRD